MYLKRKLKEIATLRIGYQFREKIQIDNTSNIPVIRLNDINKNGKIAYNDLLKAKFKKEPNDFQYIKQGDILFKSRGYFNSTENIKNAILVDQKINNTVATAPLYIVNITSNEIIPEYLYWYLNNKPSQHYIRKHIKGTTILHISKQALEELPIEIPSIEKQKKICALDKCLKEYRELSLSLIEKYESIVEAAILKVIKGKE